MNLLGADCSSERVGCSLTQAGVEVVGSLMVEGYRALVEGVYSSELVGCNLVEVEEGCKRQGVDSWLVVVAYSCFHIWEEGAVDHRTGVAEDHSWGEAGHSWSHIEAWGILQEGCNGSVAGLGEHSCLQAGTCSACFPPAA